MNPGKGTGVAVSGVLDVGDGEVQFCGKGSVGGWPAGLHDEVRWPRLLAAGGEDTLARVVHTALIRLERLEQLQVDQVAEAWVLALVGRAFGNRVQLLSDLPTRGEDEDQLGAGETDRLQRGGGDRDELLVTGLCGRDLQLWR